ncbi:MAG: cation:proton antiporter [Kofleriaceae bacterium]
MASADELLKALAIVLGVAGLTTIVFQRLGQPVVLGYILAGLIVGPHVPTGIVADPAVIHTLSELGVILLMFSLGLEFRIGKLVAVIPKAGLAAVVEWSIMVWLGFLVGRAFGWSTTEAIFCGAMIAISSTTIVAKAFDEQKVSGSLRELVVGILIVEDLLAVLMMAILTAISAGGFGADTFALAAGKLAAFLAGTTIVGMLVIPRLVRAVVKLGRPETTVVASVGVCFALALLAHELGYSVALGAFIAGSLVAESGHAHEIEQRIVPVRDVFAAIFFVSVGMSIDPATVATHWLPVVVLTAVVIAGKLGGVSLGSFLSGNGIRTSVRAGMSLTQIGEFSFIIAGLGLTLHATGDFLYPVAIAVSAITTLTTPWLIRGAGPFAAWIDHKLPHRLQTFASLYGSWLERMRATKASGTRRQIRLLGLDAAVLVAIVIGASFAEAPVAKLGLPSFTAVIAAVVLSLPFLIGIVRSSRKLGHALALAALPTADLDLATAPRRALVVTLQLAIVLVVGLPVLALTQPFVAIWPLPFILGAFVIVLVVILWRNATELEGHVKAGAQVLVEALASHASFDEVHSLVPGIGEPIPITLAPESSAVGRTLAQLDLRGLTGGSVLAISREGGGVIGPTATEILRAGDVLALAGTTEAIEAASALLATVK